MIGTISGYFSFNPLEEIQIKKINYILMLLKLTISQITLIPYTTGN